MQGPSERELERVFGFNTFRTGQKEIITNVLAGRNVLAVLPTGTGKTLCYQYPARFLPGITVIVSPLLSLMEDQVQQLKGMGEKGAAALNSHVSYEDRQRILDSLNDRSLLFLSPEMLQNKMVLERLKKVRTGLFAVDEAHCISQWGHEFRTDYLKLAQVRRALGNPPCLALTATATKKVQSDIITHLDLENVRQSVYSVDRPNISLHVKKADSWEEKEDILFTALKSHPKPGIVFTATRAEAEKLAVKIRNKCGLKTVSYHGGMEKEDRLLVQQQFLSDETDVVCCTNAFGMGINKPNVAFVIHYHLPQSPEHYLQETGRAGRGGDPASALLLYQSEDRQLPLSMISSELPDDNELSLLYERLLQIRNSGEPAPLTKDAVKTCTAEETKQRLLCFYLEQAGTAGSDGRIRLGELDGNWKEQLQLKFQMRKREKEAQFLEVERIVNSRNSCFRNAFLSYFGEESTSSPDRCCTNCGHEFEAYPAVNKDIYNHSYKKPAGGWDDMLRTILHQKKQTGEAVSVEQAGTDH
ncbi:RecQ family ATP-dependent DNA helicase [Alteribacter lacisalsi]|nr:ATP-dependent DNA helicase RecQ [Alteribacter lacisalsi]